jgi:hypothetical protein
VRIGLQVDVFPNCGGIKDNPSQGFIQLYQGKNLFSFIFFKFANGF